ncbi:tyrosine-type recombinase/integrase [Aquibacillus albus]|uniref:Integrase n=1 Tax=Aquibacillus albus TaxID=1168171 RepID=A0ABS2N698_9BACI|nr:tyrosine-type recombinase/integrase [Aquibacillus albus]MBM7573633.1 integrase [Aquibacillus albus]
MNTVEPIRSKKDINAIKRALSGRNRLLWTFGINSGLRISDILALTVEDIIDESGKPRQAVTLKEKKTRKTKTFHLNKSIQTELKRAIKAGDLDASNRESYIFASRKGNEAISRVQAYRILNAAAEKSGLAGVKIGTHSMRKTFGYHAYTAGVPLERLQRIFNHSSQAVTLDYIGITQQDIDDVYKALSL